MKYHDFIELKRHLGDDQGFEPLWMPDFLFDFQKSLVEWSIMKGRSATYANCGLGKSPMQLVWAENVLRKTNKPVLILTPLSISSQTHEEGEKFGVETQVSRDGKFKKTIVLTNYERLHYFNPQDFGGLALDESSILKNYDGKIKEQVTDFMRKMRYRSLYSATPAPNDYIELGNSSEALGYLGYIDMLKTFFKANDDSYA
ncbi:MAG: helicase, partial [Patescibacteria group bacterium]|nr:helicase [Patescibacteria group bacterium]